MPRMFLNGTAMSGGADHPDEPVVVDPARLYDRHPCTPYAGRTLTGAIRTTWLRGEVAGDVHRGRLLVREEA